MNRQDAARRGFEATMFETRFVRDTAAPPAYQRIVRIAVHLRQLGFSLSAISGRLGVTG